MNVLPPETTQDLTSISPDGATYTFSQMTPALASVAPGEIIAAGISDATPDGFLRRVTAVDASGSQVVMQTQPATLEDAVQQGEFSISKKLSPTNLQAEELSPGVTLMPKSMVSPNSSFYAKIEDVVVFDLDGNLATTGDQVLAKGSIEFEPTVDFRVRERDWEIEEVYFGVTIQETAALDFEAKPLELELMKGEYQLGKPIRLPSFEVMIGLYPVVVVPVLTFQVGVDGSVHLGVTAGVKQVLTATAGVRYVNAAWGPVSSFSNYFTFTPPTLHAGLEFKGYASARLQALLYGIAGPYAEVGPYLKLEADTCANPWWQLYGGLEVPVGVRVDLLGHKKIASYQVLALGTKYVLAQATSPSPDPSPSCDMVLVPAGTFQMGCAPAHNGGWGCYGGEWPLHTVYLDAYRIDKTEVTNAQYAKCVAAGGCTTPTDNSSYTRASFMATRPTPTTR
jgi:hypothetical protein